MWEEEEEEEEGGVRGSAWMYHYYYYYYYYYYYSHAVFQHLVGTVLGRSFHISPLSTSPLV